MLRAAFDGDADYTATGDRHLLKLKKFMNMTMITVKEMLKILEE